IVNGRVKKYFSESTLAEQTYLLDDSKTVGAFLKGEGLELRKFVRYGVGEGIEKRQDDFAAEVAEAIK
ncbi:MAG: elongation factor Ts, partial [Erysipelotrichaceae bacterium]|nr:elongation factor Ts [Erysipelotrichaceae bacterium]